MLGGLPRCWGGCRALTRWAGQGGGAAGLERVLVLLFFAVLDRKSSGMGIVMGLHVLDRRNAVLRRGCPAVQPGRAGARGTGAPALPWLWNGPRDLLVLVFVSITVGHKLDNIPPL